jgi:Txe/YoeB family toxin of toxin-antitoxin system
VYRAILSRQAQKDLDRLKRAGLGGKAKKLVDIIEENPYKTPPRYEKLTGDLQGYYSRRINDQHRFVYDVKPNIENLKDSDGKLYKGIIHILRMWTHYE